jgi:hypothetical protein
MSTPGSTSEEPDSGYSRLEQQIRWYDSKSGSAQKWFKWVKYLEFVCGAIIPIAALTQHNGYVAAGLSALVIVLEGLQHLNQWQHNWITYRSTCETLRHEKYSYLARSGQYEGLDDALAYKLLVENVEGLVSTEHAKWLTRQTEGAKAKLAAQRRASGQPPAAAS